MAILNFQKPDKVIMIDSSEFEGKFEFRPLEPGYGLTVGNALRRVLLSSLEGFAITSVKIENVEHEFSTIPGVVEDVTEIILKDDKAVGVKLSNGEEIFSNIIVSNSTRWDTFGLKDKKRGLITSKMYQKVNISGQRPINPPLLLSRYILG